jgi:transcription antitermination factor NusB
MRKRTQAREFATQILYQIDITGDKLEIALDNFWPGYEDPVLVRGTLLNLESIDKELVQYANNWQLKRMAVVDRNILRLSCYELLFRPDIPPKVSINEAVELAKKYSGPEAGKFVNGILDKIKSEKKK